VLSYLHLIGFKVLACPLVEDIVVDTISRMAVGRHGPDSILKTHRGTHMWRGVECSQVASFVEDGDIILLLGEEDTVARNAVNGYWIVMRCSINIQCLDHTSWRQALEPTQPDQLTGRPASNFHKTCI